MSYIPLPNLQARALPAAGAYYTGATAVELLGQWAINRDGAPSITFRVTYTKGAASSGGYPIVRVVWIVLNDAGAEVEMIDALTTAGTGGVCTTDAATNKLTALTDGNPLSVAAVYVVPREVVKVRFEAAEFGDAAHPGTITVAMFGGL